MLLKFQKMAGASETRNWLEGLVRDGSLGWLMGRRSPFDDEFGDMGASVAAGRNWMVELSPIANIVVGRFSR